MFKIMSVIACLSLVPTLTFAQNIGNNFYLLCESPYVRLTFEINTFWRTVRSVEYNSDMMISYWSDEVINTHFSPPKSLGQIVPGAESTENVGVNFNRLTGVAGIGGLVEPTKEQVADCGGEEHFWCEDTMVTSIFYVDCYVIEAQF